MKLYSAMFSDTWGYESRPDLAGKALSSFVWKHFKRVETRWEVIAICFYCRQEICMPPSKSTSPLRQHINKHTEIDPDSQDNTTHVKNYYAMQKSQPPSIEPGSSIKSESPIVKQEAPRIQEVPKVQKILTQPIKEVRLLPSVTAPHKDRRLNFDVFEQNIGCAKVSMFQKKGTIKLENGA